MESVYLKMLKKDALEVGGFFNKKYVKFLFEYLKNSIFRKKVRSKKI